MATRFYLPSSTAAPYTPTPSSVWEVTTSFVSRATDTVKFDSGFATPAAVAKVSTVANDDRLHRIYVSNRQLTAQTIAAGTLSAVIKVAESATTANMWVQLVVRVMSSDGTTERGVLYGGSTATVESSTAGAENQEMPTTAATRIKSGLTTSSVVAQAGDRIHIEIGARANSTSSTVTSTFSYGETLAAGEYALTAGLTTTLAPWVELSQDLTWQAATPVVARLTVSNPALGRAYYW